MKKTIDIETMSIDALWDLHERLVSILDKKIAAEKSLLEERLRKINALPLKGNNSRPRRPYPKVGPKFRNPSNPSETWAGRGKMPRWVQAQLKSGRKLEDLRIRSS